MYVLRLKFKFKNSISNKEVIGEMQSLVLELNNPLYFHRIFPKKNIVLCVVKTENHI